MRRILVLLAALCFAPPASIGAAGAVANETGAAGRDRLLFDFESDDWQAAWSAMGGIVVTRVPRDAEGNALELRGAGDVYTKPGRVPVDWSGFETLSFDLWRDVPVDATNQYIEVRAMDRDGRGRRWRKVPLEPGTGWREIALPLRFFGPGDERILPWSEVQRLGFHIAAAGTVRVDRITLRPGARRAVLDAPELVGLAFSSRPAATVVDQPGLLFATDVAGVDFVPLVAELTNLVAVMERDLPFLTPPDEPPALLVFSDETGYRGFTPRFAAAFRRVAAPPASDGFTLLGIATGAWDPAQGIRRPTYLHEFVHSLVERRTGLPNRSEWFQEGLATRYQVRFRPQEGLDRIIAAGLAQDSHRDPLLRLCNGKPVSLRRYWQAMTVVDLLVDHDHYRPRLAALVDAFRASGTTDIGPHLGPVLGVDGARFEADWQAHTRTRIRLVEGGP